MNKKIASAFFISVCLSSTLLPNGFVALAGTKAIQAQSLVGIITDPVGDVTIEDATSVNFDITKVSFSSEQGNLIIEFEVSGARAREFSENMDDQL